MMAYPAESTKSVEVRDRIIAILKEIVAGTNFYYTPGVVYDNFKNWKEREAYPAYAVFYGAGGEWQERQGLQAAETFTIIVHGDFSDSEDAPKAVRLGLRDVRKCVMDDMTSSATIDVPGDSLGTLCDHLTLGATTTDNGTEALLGSGWFDQEFQITISGKIEDL
jgi:hypothetical protein